MQTSIFIHNVFLLRKIYGVKRVSKIAKPTIGFVMSVRMEQLVSHYKNFYEIWYVKIFRKYVEKIQVSLKYDRNKEYWTWKLVDIYDNIS